MKHALRVHHLGRRQALKASIIRTKSRKILTRLFKAKFFHDAQLVLTYMQHRNEVDTTLLIEMYAMKKKLFVPIIKNERMCAARFTDGVAMKRRRFGIREPLAQEVLRTVKKLDLVIVPGVAFDLRGHRIGYGGGYFDRFLKKVSCPKIGLAFEGQLIEKVPTHSYDVPVDYIITEKRIIACQNYRKQIRQSTKSSRKRPNAKARE